MLYLSGLRYCIGVHRYWVTKLPLVLKFIVLSSYFLTDYRKTCICQVWINNTTFRRGDRHAFIWFSQILPCKHIFLGHVQHAVSIKTNIIIPVRFPWFNIDSDVIFLVYKIIPILSINLKLILDTRLNSMKSCAWFNVSIA